MTESDFVYKVIVHGKYPNNVRVYEHMTKPCIVVNPQLALEYVARLFADHHLRPAPVISGDLLGIISLTDILARSSSLEKLRTILLKQELQDEMKRARIICTEKGVNSSECSGAWDLVEEVQAIAHQRAKKPLKSAFEEYCDEYPEAEEARVYDL